MKYIKPVDGLITSDWAELRPLLAEVKTHPHAAIDIETDVGDPIHAMCDGTCYFFKLTRHDRVELWEEPLDSGKVLPWSYGYDLYGGIIVLVDDKNYVNLITHCYFKGMFEGGVIPKNFWVYDEESTDERFPMELMHTFDHPFRVKQGQIIGVAGNAGFSTGSHIHWEIHRGWKKTPYENRPNPENYI